MANKSTQGQKMFSLINDWKQSGQSQMAFCKFHSIPYQQFRYWQKRYKSSHSPAPNSNSSFIRLVAPIAEDRICAEIVFPDGKRILFHQAVAINQLKALLV